ncbi:MAG: SulP family inorganic anion transporter [Paracoccus sp. (in: a-proteobacteria)]|uniref:SulP family inorganic anion transporter n=1 Tax=Paracoccus sp. TaxID=267 RepID=UPI0026E0244A|nr:SulP family inorganic anion transporter [Paracoccus sp. (in: a-proteobacteria)]MDO5612161.1 SulP family inorganic anion transporter [Paracoccus sp. (in: a-proteobacteria)]
MFYRPAILDLRFRRADLSAGLTVAIVALPLSMAIAIASGVGPDRGLVTAIVGGFLVSAMGGTRHQIGGPAGAFIVLVSACVAAIGVQGLILATMMSGVMLALLGLFRMGGTIRYVPYPVILGFTAAIGVIILTSQMKDLFGLQLPGAEPGPLIEKIPALLAVRDTASWASLAIALLTIATILGCQRWAPRLPSLLIAVAVATLAGLALPVETVADRFGALPAGLPMPELPMLSPETMRAALPFAISFTLLGAIESLLSGIVADQMAGTRMRADDELIGQGIANIGVGLFGGFCTTGTIARTATNVRAGSAGPGSGMIHAAILLITLMIAAPLAGAIPLAGLAGLLTVVAWNMVEIHAITALARISRGDAITMAVTFLVTIFRDVTEGIIIGMALGGAVFIARMAQLSQAVPGEGFSARDPDIVTCHLGGPVFFGSVARMESLLHRIVARPRLVVLDMSGVTFLDTTGAQMIADFSRRLSQRKTALVVTGASPRVRATLSGDLTFAATPDEARAMTGL